MVSTLMTADLLERAKEVIDDLAQIDDLDERMDVINELRGMLHEHSPMKDEPVDYVRWERSERVEANDFNPNSVAPPEMDLLKVSIRESGYTQPIVAYPPEGHSEDTIEIIDGFHRHLVGKQDRTIRRRVRGRLPITMVQPDQWGEADRIAAMTRHNRARGQHSVEQMSANVIALYRRHKKSKEWLAEHMGMSQEETDRLLMVGGLGEAFADNEFSRAWNVRDSVDLDQLIIPEGDDDE